MDQQLGQPNFDADQPRLHAEDVADKTLDVLLDTEDDVIDMKSRLIRIEIRLSKLLIHMGLGYDGRNLADEALKAREPERKRLTYRNGTTHQPR